MRKNWGTTFLQLDTSSPKYGLGWDIVDFKDKDYDQILRIMSEVSDTLITFTPKHPRGLESSALASQATHYFDDVEDGQTARKALERAKIKTDPGGLILIFGSLSTISTFYEIFS